MLMHLNMIMFFRSSFVASMGSAVASTPIDVIRVSILLYVQRNKYFFFKNIGFLDPIDESKDSTHN